jgi:hypothetical protein
MRPIKRRRIIKIVLAVVLVLFAALMALAIYAQTASRNSQPISTSISVPQPKPPREVKDVLTSDSGDLIITYTDGSTQNAGRVVGASGESQAPTQSQISAALIEYCASGRCDSKAPTQQQILEAVATYCAGGICKGSDGSKGADAQPITADQILAAVTSYCADGRCKGADGQSITGAQGEPGKSPVMNCVARTVNGLNTKFVAWKYETEPNSAYRDLYKLPVWAECTNPVDLTGGGA